MKESRMTAEDFARYRVEMTRRELHKLMAAVELGTDVGCRLSAILENAINEVEMLAEDAKEAED